MRWPAQEKELQKLREAEERRRDTLDFEQHIMPQVKDLEKQALKLVPDALDDPVINRNTARRDEERVKKTIEAYGEAEAVLRPALDVLRQAGPYGDPEVEKPRQVRLELIEARLDLFARNKRCLEMGKDWPHQDEDKREEAINRVRDLQRDWDKLLAR